MRQSAAGANIADGDTEGPCDILPLTTTADVDADVIYSQELPLLRVIVRICEYKSYNELID